MIHQPELVPAAKEAYIPSGEMFLTYSLFIQKWDTMKNTGEKMTKALKKKKKFV